MPAGKLRILQVMRAPVGGLFRHVADLTTWLNENGYEVGLVVDSLANDAQTESRLEALSAQARLGIHRIAMPRLLGRGDLHAPLVVRRLARSLGIDVLHGHGAKGGFYARLARLGRPQLSAFYTPHGGVLHFPRTSPSGRLFHLLERRLMAQTSAIIFESAYAQSTYAGLIGEPSCPTKVIHNGLRAAEFAPVRPSLDASDFVFVGELRELKGIFVLLEAMVGLQRADGTPATLVMAGDGPARAELVSAIEQRGLSNQISLAGAQPARSMFARGRIAVVPSLAESLPYIILEATAAQLPVIATRVGGVPEIFGPTGASLIPAGDSRTLHIAMQQALDNPGAAQEEMRARLSFVEERFSSEVMASHIAALYERSLRRA